GRAVSFAARPAVLGIAVGAAVAMSAAAAHALEVRITTVRAADRGPSDAQLIELRPRLRRLVGYRSFQVVRDERRRCAWQTAEAFKIPGGRMLHVVPKARRDQAVVLQVRLIDRQRRLLDTDVRLQNRGVMLFGVDQDSRPADGPIIIMLKAEDG
ncbi:MAG TPA: hypothetical protein VKA21_14970, partial [Candidatus Binatia bacterium]|nr:hypothetical protein [Candidatus Binatia bacterium]